MGDPFLEDKLGKPHAGQLRRERAEAKAERIVAEELQRLGWPETELAARRKRDPDKLAVAARLRRETTLTLRAIAARVHLGTSRSANARLHQWLRGATNNPPETREEYDKTNHAMGDPFSVMILLAICKVCATLTA